MHHRLSLWMALFAFAALGAMCAQTPAAPAPAAMVPGQIKAMQVTGSVSMVLNGTTTALHDNDPVSQLATIITQNDSSVVLVFSNGATTQLGGDTTLSIDQFLQDPITSPVNIGALTTEPTHSKTKLHLTKGELLGKVAHLKIDEGSSFTVETPVGAAGIRGTTFRIVFRPTGTGQAFAMFALSTVEGNVNFQQGGANGPGAQPGGQPSGPNPGGTPGQPTQPGQGGPATTPGSGVAVTGGQEVVVTVSVNVNSQTGQVEVTAPVQVATTTPINPVTEAALVSQATNLATTVAAATFTPTQPTTPETSGGTTNSTGTTKDDKKQGDTSGGDSSGGNSNGTQSGGGTGNGSNPAPSQDLSQPPSNGFGASPPPTNNPLALDPATGQPTH